jgi:hypothetical protein
MKNLIFLCAALLLVVSCGKLGKTTVEGRVINAVTGQPIADVPMELWEYCKGYSVQNCNSLISSTRTDAQGHFSFKFHERNSDWEYTAAIETETQRNYMSDNTGLDIWRYKAVSSDSDNITLRVVPLGYLKTSYKNKNYVDDNDLFRIRSYYSALPQSSDTRWGEVKGAYEYIDSDYSNLAMGWLVTEWQVFRTGKPAEYHTDSLYIEAGKKYERVINY